MTIIWGKKSVPQDLKMSDWESPEESRGALTIDIEFVIRKY